jgi:hypothetical protein
MRFVVDHHRAGDVVEPVERTVVEPRLERLGKRNDLLRPDGNAAAAKLEHEGD